MEPADLRKRHDLATADRLHRPSVGRILVERKVTSGAMIIVQEDKRTSALECLLLGEKRTCRQEVLTSACSQ